MFQQPPLLYTRRVGIIHTYNVNYYNCIIINSFVRTGHVTSGSCVWYFDIMIDETNCVCTYADLANFYFKHSFCAPERYVSSYTMLLLLCRVDGLSDWF